MMTNESHSQGVYDVFPNIRSKPKSSRSLDLDHLMIPSFFVSLKCFPINSLTKAADLTEMHFFFILCSSLRLAQETEMKHSNLLKKLLLGQNTIPVVQGTETNPKF
jgi:hypothetical protein